MRPEPVSGSGVTPAQRGNERMIVEMTKRDEFWWRHGIFYQIYPRSFQDSNADGVGDLKGIIARLPYVQALGVDAIWLSPIFPSPMADFGYDIADYIGIDSLFGTMGDFDAMVAAAHQSGLKVILDLVPNHTSDKHPWFTESRSSRDNAKRDWYIWRAPAADGGPPNNWMSEFGGPPSAAGARQMYQSRLALSRELRLSVNQGCLSEVWFGTRSRMTLSPLACAALMRSSKSAIVPNSGSMPV